MSSHTKCNRCLYEAIKERYAKDGIEIAVVPHPSGIFKNGVTLVEKETKRSLSIWFGSLPEKCECD